MGSTTNKTSFKAGDLMRVPRVAQVLDVTKKRVYKLIRDGRLEVIKIGPRGTRVTRESLDAYIRRLIQNSRFEREGE